MGKKYEYIDGAVYVEDRLRYFCDVAEDMEQFVEDANDEISRAFQNGHDVGTAWTTKEFTEDLPTLLASVGCSSVEELVVRYERAILLLNEWAKAAHRLKEPIH